MNQTLVTIKALANQRKVRISDHGLEELRADGIRLSDVIMSIDKAVVVEDYPTAFKGPTVLALQTIAERSVHVVWGLTKASPDIATLVTAYFPDPEKWYHGYMKRKPK